jgi:uncharacterized lipoprotein YddW (UPF0748 family)
MKIELIKTKFKVVLFTFAFLLLPSLSSAQTKAVWVRPFIGANEETRKDAARGRDFIRRELEKIKRANLNTIYLEVFWDGYTIYPTRVAAQRPSAIAYGTADTNGKGWDALQVYLDEAAKLNIRVHAWIHVFHQWNTNLGGLENSPIFSKHPDWAMLDKNGSPLVKAEAEGANRDIYKVFISPSNKEVRVYLRRIVGELVDDYPRLAGIQWDYIRYPLQTGDAPFDYNPLTLAQFQTETKLDAAKLSAKDTPQQWKIWQDWKTRQVTETVEELGAVVRQKRPKWEVSAAVFANIEENLRLKQQDWKNWANKGYVDALLPMLYSTDYARVESWARDFRRDVSPKTKVYPAFFIGHFYDAKQRKLDDRYLRINEKYKFDGVGFFAAQSLTDDLIEKLAKENTTK